MKNVRLSSWRKFERELRANVSVPKVVTRNFRRVDFDSEMNEIDALAHIREHGTDRRPGAQIWYAGGFDFDHSRSASPPQSEDILYGYPVSLVTPYLVDVSDHQGVVHTEHFDLVENFDRNTALAVYDFSKLSQVAPYEFTFVGPKQDALILLMYTARKP